MLLLFFCLPFEVWAAEGDCVADFCLVPAPTVLSLNNDQILDSGRLTLSGLAWKTTLVRIFVDGKEVRAVRQFDHEDQYVGFYADLNLSSGRHYLYTTAYSDSKQPGPYDQSQESKYIYFTVQEPARDLTEADQPLLEDDFEINEKQSDQMIVNDQALAEDLSMDIVNASSTAMIDVADGRIEGGVFIEEDLQNFIEEFVDEQVPLEEMNQELQMQPAATFNDLSETLKGEFENQKSDDVQKRNRLIGYVLLIIIILAYLIRWIVKKGLIRRINNDGKLFRIDKDKDYLDKSKVDFIEPTLEPFSEEESGYWPDQPEEIPVVEDLETGDFEQPEEIKNKEYYAAPPPVYDPYGDNDESPDKRI